MNTSRTPRDGERRERSRGPRGHHGRTRSGESPFGADQPRRGRRGGRGRAPRGDVRAAVLTLLAEEPMHGYQLMQAIADRSSGRWTPSPGAIYPTLNQLEDEGLVAITKESGRRLATLTDSGREQLDAHQEQWAELWSAYEGADNGVDLRELLAELHSAARQVGKTGTDTQRAAAAEVLKDARRTLYLLLADEESDSAH
ncbi:PadR family transcriptional regulator [Solicola gregarius]|uniref:PadR family transcriptional regulator n=1 Tax=Solicola gregarius TaxID=2908642 RepID=A0AA46YP60_9ACTN|nr:PadR family transcriptional regulator [Solicola gregarius]UYM07303.1 PadR family transcriptional regulator [Solicola gregarius]